MEIGATDPGGVQQAASGDSAIGLSRKGILDGPKPSSPLRRAIERQDDQAIFSPEGLAAATQASAEPDESGAQESLIREPAGDELTEEEQREIDDLQQRDRDVRRHEQAHKAAAGSYARGAASLEYTVGPDGKRYASGGNVKIDVSPERTPEGTIRKMKVIQRAALAPAEPSAQDRGVYRTAVRQEQAARQELAEERQAEAQAARETGGGQVDADPIHSQPLIPEDSLGPSTIGVPGPDASPEGPSPRAGVQQPGTSQALNPQAGNPLAPPSGSPGSPVRPGASSKAAGPLKPPESSGNPQAGVPTSGEQTSPLAPPRQPLIGPISPPTATLDERI